jgi:hypothetical protein
MVGVGRAQRGIAGDGHSGRKAAAGCVKTLTVRALRSRELDVLSAERSVPKIGRMLFHPRGTERASSLHDLF